MQYIFQGTLAFVSADDWTRIRLVQTDGAIIDLVREIQNRKLDGEAFLRYYITNQALSIEEAVESNIWGLYGGDIEAEYSIETECYSEWTGCIDYQITTLTCGEHDLYEELSSYEGKFLTLIIDK